MRLRTAAIAAFLPLITAGCASIATIPTAEEAQAQAQATGVPAKADAAITNALVDVLERKDQVKIDLTTAQGTPLGDILTVGSPIGYNLRNRYLKVGVPIAEALSRNPDPVFREKLVTLARWDHDGETRSAGLVAVARKQDINDYAIFNEALIHLDPAVRFGALEALEVWGHSEKAVPLLGQVAQHDTEPILQVYASKVLAKLGDESGLQRLRGYLDNPSWLVRAMAARYLGDLGQAGDYDLLVSRIGREQSNDFVVAEMCISALKLFPKKNPG